MSRARLVMVKSDLVLLLALFSMGEVVFQNKARADAGQFNGVYAGTQTLTENSSVINYSKWLKGPFKRKLVVQDGTVTYVFNPTYQGTVTGTVDADGDVSGNTAEPAGGVNLSGKIDGDSFTGEIWSLYCTYTLNLKRAP
jgi:uncharacterized protein YdeI (BOF family)